MKRELELNGESYAMSFQESINGALHELKRNGIPAREIARIANIRDRCLYSLTDNSSDTLNSACALIVRLAILGQPLPLDMMAKDAGYLIIRNPEASVTSVPCEMIKACGDFLREAADVVDEAAKAVADGTITDAEHEKLCREIREAQGKLAEVAQMSARMRDEGKTAA